MARVWFSECRVTGRHTHITSVARICTFTGMIWDRLLQRKRWNYLTGIVPVILNGLDYNPASIFIDKIHVSWLTHGAANHTDGKTSKKITFSFVFCYKWTLGLF